MSSQIVQLTDKKLLEQLILNLQQQVSLLTEIIRRSDPTQTRVPLRKECNGTSTYRRTQKNKPINNSSSRKHMLANQKTYDITQKQLEPALNFSELHNQSSDETISSKRYEQVIKPYLSLRDRTKASLVDTFDELALLWQYSEQKRNF